MNDDGDPPVSEPSVTENEDHSEEETQGEVEIWCVISCDVV